MKNNLTSKTNMSYNPDKYQDLKLSKYLAKAKIIQVSFSVVKNKIEKSKITARKRHKKT